MKFNIKIFIFFLILMVSIGMNMFLYSERLRLEILSVYSGLTQAVVEDIFKKSDMDTSYENLLSVAKTIHSEEKLEEVMVCDEVFDMGYDKKAIKISNSILVFKNNEYEFSMFWDNCKDQIDDSWWWFKQLILGSIWLPFTELLNIFDNSIHPLSENEKLELADIILVGAIKADEECCLQGVDHIIVGGLNLKLEEDSLAVFDDKRVSTGGNVRPEGGCDGAFFFGSKVPARMYQVRKFKEVDDRKVQVEWGYWRTCDDWTYISSTYEKGISEWKLLNTSERNKKNIKHEQYH